MASLVSVAIAIAALVLYKLYRWWSKALWYIPGPRPIPFIGNLHQLDPTRTQIQFTDWREKYGDVFRINVFGDCTVVVNGRENIRDVLVNKGLDFAGRPDMYRARLCVYDCNDIGFQSYTPRLQHMRKVGHWALKSYGVGMDRLEQAMLDGTKELLENLSSYKGQPVDVQPLLHLSVCNIMTTIITGKGFKTTDDEVTRMLSIDELFNAGLHPVNGAELDAFPWLRFLGNKCYKVLKQGTDLRDEFIDRYFQVSKETLQPGVVRGVFDALFLNQASSNNNNKFGPVGTLDDQSIKGIVNDLIIAGTITTVTALHVSFLVLINRPDILKKLLASIKKVVPRDRLPTLQDRPHIPYVDAFIYEILRYASHVPLALPHVAMKDSSIAGYAVPQGTQILVNTWGLHHDEHIYESPWTFKPERFLEPNGNLVTADHPARRNLLVFGAGRRICIGEQLAKARLFLITSAIVQNFDLQPEDLNNIPSPDPREYSLGVVLMPAPFKVRVIPRCD